MPAAENISIPIPKKTQTALLVYACVRNAVERAESQNNVTDSVDNTTTTAEMNTTTGDSTTATTTTSDAVTIAALQSFIFASIVTASLLSVVARL